MKRSAQVEIAGVKLSIRSEEGPAYVQELAEYVDARVRELAVDSRTSYNLQRIALLVALQIADELFREKDLHERLRRRIGARLQTLDHALRDHESQLRDL